ncbi:hypothetical protein MTP99_002136 [Tenebrio molitor]|jgi:hypothetical protein|nr:hypothetical protein MTP99_002136 [Tenebrio molitor]CAH1365857.1 unnamed protein product [Tenebrio molitor]
MSSRTSFTGESNIEMNLLEEHNYESSLKIKMETEKGDIDPPQLNIKMECDYHNSGSNDFIPDDEEVDQVESEADQCIINDISTTKNRMKSESDGESGRRLSTASNGSLSDLRKACILQTCLSLVDSSSSDDDELILLWLLCKNKKKKLKRKHRI